MKISPFQIKKPWAGSLLSRWTQYSPEIGELVLFSSLEKFLVQIDDQSFSDWWRNSGKMRAEALGYRSGAEFPLMLKLLSLGEPLSLQLHPGDEELEALSPFSKGRDKGFFRSKDEAWLILDSASDAMIFAGLKPEAKLDDLTQIKSIENIDQFLFAHKPVPGTWLDFPPGTIHGSIGEIFALEIQQNSDTTFRLYDFNRGRELHPEEAKVVVNQRGKVQPTLNKGKKFSFRNWTILTLEKKINVSVAFVIKVEFEHKKPFLEISWHWNGEILSPSKETTSFIIFPDHIKND